MRRFHHRHPYRREIKQAWFWLERVSALVGDNHPVFYFYPGCGFYFVSPAAGESAFNASTAAVSSLLSEIPPMRRAEEFIRRVQEAKEKYLRRHLKKR